MFEHVGEYIQFICAWKCDLKVVIYIIPIALFFWHLFFVWRSHPHQDVPNPKFSVKVNSIISQYTWLDLIGQGVSPGEQSLPAHVRKKKHMGRDFQALLCRIQGLAAPAQKYFLDSENSLSATFRRITPNNILTIEPQMLSEKSCINNAVNVCTTSIWPTLSTLFPF